MENKTSAVAETAMLIRKPVHEIFEAFINPEITTNFWFTRSTGRLVEGETVEWTWKMYDHTVAVFVKSITPEEKIVIEWGNYKEKTTVEWTFKPLGESKTFVTIINSGFTGSPEELLDEINDSVGGFTWVLAGLKAYLEHDIHLNLTADRFPKEMRGE